MPPPYSAGTAFLQVVPSFRDVQNNIGKQAQDLGRALGRDMGQNFDKEFAEKAVKSSVKSGETAAKNYSGAFRQGLRKNLTAAVSQLGTEIDKTLGASLKGLNTLKDLELKPNWKAEDALAAMGRFELRLKDIADNDPSLEARFNAAKAITQLSAFRKEVEKEFRELTVEARIGGKFEEEAKRRVKAAESALPALNVGFSFDKNDVAISGIKAALKSLSEMNISPDFDAPAMLRDIETVDKQLKALDDEDLRPDLKFGLDEARKQLKNFLEGVNPPPLPLEVDPELNQGKFINKVRQIAQIAQGALPPVDLSVATSDAERQAGETFNKIRAQVIALGNLKISPDFDATEVVRDSRLLITELRRIDGMNVSPDIKIKTAAAIAELMLIDNAAKKTSNNADLTANSFRFFNGVLLAAASVGPALIPILAAIAGGLLAIGPAAVAGGAGLLGMVLGFSGIGKAVSALGQAQKDAGATAVANARTMADATRGVADAQRGLDGARENAGRAAEDSARRISDARQAEARTQQDVARSIESALEQQGRAEEALVDAQRNALRAQQDLTDAREQAQRSMEDLDSQVSRGRLDERSAVLDVGDARSRLNSARSDPGATATEREEAAIALERALLALTDQRRENARLAEEQEESRRKGIEGSDAVTSAQDRVAEALRAQERATRDVGRAAEEVDRARTDGAAALATASRAVADAIVAADRSRIDSSASVADAQRGLDEAQRRYNEALYDTGVQGSASMRAVNEAMSALGPSGQAFVIFLVGLRGQFQELRDSLQAGFLPGVQEAIEILLTTYGPGLNDFFVVLGNTLGDLFRRAAEVFTSPIWQEFFGMMAEYAPEFIRLIGEIAFVLATTFASLLTTLAPFSERFAEALLVLTENFLAFVQGLADSPQFENFLGYVVEVAPKVLEFFFAFVDAVLAILEAVAPFGEVFLTIFTAVSQFVAALDPKILNIVVTAVIGIVLALQALAGILATAGFIASLMAAGIGGIVTAAALVVAGLILLGVALVNLYSQSETFRNIVNAAWQGVKDGFALMVEGIKAVWDNVLKPTIDGIIAIITWLWENVAMPYFRFMGEAWSTLFTIISTVWNDIGRPIFDLFRDVVTAVWENVVKPIFTAVGDAWMVLFNGVKWVWDNVAGPVFQLFMEIIKTVYDIYFKPYVDAIAEIWSRNVGKIKDTYNNFLVPVFNALIEIIRDKVAPIFETAVDAVGRAWDKLRNLSRDPIRFVVETILNNGLIKGFNTLARAFKTDEIPDIKLPAEFYKASGGPIPGFSPSKTADNVPIMATAGEFMQPVDSVQYYGRGFMEAIRRRVLPREFVQHLAQGGIVGLGKRFQQMGADVGQHPAFGPYRRRGTGSRHDLGQAIDVNAGAGTSAAEQRRLFPLADIAQSMGFRTIFMTMVGGDHYNHLHVDEGPGRNIGYVSGGAKNATGPEGDSGLLDVLGSPIEYLKNSVSGLFEKVTDSTFGKMAVGGARFMLDSAVDAAGRMVAEMGDFIGRGVGAVTDFFAPDSAVKDVIQGVAGGYGWDKGNEWNALQWLVNKESSFNPRAQNPTSSAYGLFQFLNSTWAGVGAKKTSDPRDQTVAGLKYVAQRYGSPSAAMAFHKKNNWYGEGGEIQPETHLFDTGGVVPPGLSYILNNTGANEINAILTPEQIQWAEGGKGTEYNITLPMMPTNATPEAVADEVLFAARQMSRGGVYAGRPRG